MVRIKIYLDSLMELEQCPSKTFVQVRVLFEVFDKNKNFCYNICIRYEKEIMSAEGHILHWLCKHSPQRKIHLLFLVATCL